MTLKRLFRAALAVVAIVAALPAHAVQPDEVLADPALEARAREISEELRCLVCRNESIDDSNADLARDLRIIVRERLKAGDTDAEVRGYLVDRYGEFILLQPRFSLANAAIWLAGPVLFLLGLLAALAYLRGRRADAVADATLSVEERAALDRILSEERG